MKRRKKIPSSQESIERFCINKYKKIVEYRRLKFLYIENYFLTEYGHLIRYSEYSGKVKMIKGMTVKGRTSKDGKRWKSGFVVDQFYRTIDGKSKRFWVIPRSKLMFMVFKNWSRSQVKSHFIFPIDQNPKNLHIDNLKPFKKYIDGHIAIYGKLNSGRLSNIDVVKIRKSKKTNRELSEKYDRSMGTISRIRNGRAYQNIKVIST